MSNILVGTACLYFWHPERYEDALDERIHACLDAGADGVEISNGPSILTWRPASSTRARLKRKILTVHAEIFPDTDCNLVNLTRALRNLNLPIANVTFHPDELTQAELASLPNLGLPVSIENMDITRSNWQTVAELEAITDTGVGLTYDTAHGEETGLTLLDCALLPIRELHVSHSGMLFNDESYNTLPIPAKDVRHTLLHMHPCDIVLPDIELITIEGLLPPRRFDLLQAEIQFVKERLLKGCR